MVAFHFMAFMGLNPYAVSNPKCERPCTPTPMEKSSATTMTSYGPSARWCLIRSMTATNMMIAFRTCAQNEGVVGMIGAIEISLHYVHKINCNLIHPTRFTNM